MLNIVMTLAGASSKKARLHHIALPKSFAAPEMAKVQRDCEILIERLKSHPEGFQDLMKLANSGDLSGVRTLAKGLRLTEPDFEKDGGGCFFLLFCAAILVLAWIDRDNIEGIRIGPTDGP